MVLFKIYINFIINCLQAAKQHKQKEEDAATQYEN